MTWLNNSRSWAMSVLRGGRGYQARSDTTQPGKMLELWEFEACPYCRKVREVFSELDLNYRCYPCGRGSRHRAEVASRGGEEMFPYLHDPNTGAEMYESEGIISYLLETYSHGRGRVSRALAPINTLTSAAVGIWRPARGFRVRKSSASRSAPAQPLVLYGFEISPYCRKVREALVEVDVSYECRNVAKKSARRPELVERGGKMRVPFLSDPNTGVELYESDDIVRYIFEAYG